MIYAIDENKVHRKVDIAEADRLHDLGHKIVSADSEGWIECDGRFCPTEPSQLIQWKSARGVISDVVPANCVFWGDSGALKIVAYRPVLTPTAGEPVKEWDGKSLPPVGTVCEYRSGYVEQPYEYSQCTIIAHFIGESGTQLAAFTYKQHDGVVQVGRGAARLFRPLPTPRERWVESARKVTANAPDNKDYYEAIYDALASGELPLPEVRK